MRGTQLPPTTGVDTSRFRPGIEVNPAHIDNVSAVSSGAAQVGVVAAPVRATTEADRAKLQRTDPGAVIAERLGEQLNPYGRYEDQRAVLSSLSKQDQQALRRWLVKNPEPFLGFGRDRAEQLRNAAIHPAAHGPISLEKLLAVVRGEPWTNQVDQNTKVAPSVLHEIATVDRALWAQRLAVNPELRVAAEKSPVAFGALTELGVDPFGRLVYRDLEALRPWKPATKHEALTLLKDGSEAARTELARVSYFFQDVAGDRGLAMAKAMGIDGAYRVCSERVRTQLTDYRHFPSRDDRLKLIERFGLGTLASLTERSPTAILSTLRWYTDHNAGRAADVKKAIDSEGGPAIALALDEIAFTASSMLRKSGVDLMGILSFAEARAFAKAAGDSSAEISPWYGAEGLDRAGAQQIADRLRSGTSPATLIEEAAAKREKAANAARSEASARLAKADQQLGGKTDLASKLALFAVVEQTHAMLADHPLPSKRGDWSRRDAQGTALEERLMSSRQEILLLVGKEETPKLIEASKQGPEALRAAVWRMMDRLEPVADPVPGKSWGGFSLADMAPVVALLPAEMTDAFGRAFQAGRPPVTFPERELVGRTRQEGAPPFSPKHVVFRTPRAVQSLGMFGGEGIHGTDRRRWEAAIEGPFVDKTGPYLVAAFSDTGAKEPSAERLPSLVTLRPAGAKAWASADGAIALEQQLLGLALNLKPPFARG